MRRHAQQAYPAECCGILVGARGDPMRVSSVQAAENGHASHGRDRYQIAPRDILRVERAAQDEGRQVIGFYHSHPDHPATPSATDAAQAWPEYVYVIASVEAGRSKEITAWVFDDARRQFIEQPIRQEVDERMAVKVRIPTPLQPLTGGKPEVESNGATLRQVLADLEARFPGIGERLYDQQGNLRRFVNLYVNDEDVRFLRGEDTVVGDADEISIIPAIAGGGAACA
jgi:proteasome lid subunit RPN8/RPN11/molybdopterin converting factor small subunit